jgi:copper chaperone
MDKYQLRVPGITCGHCVSAITTSVSRVPGVDAVDVDLASKTVHVAGSAPLDSVRAAIDDAGYEVAS